MGSGSSANYNLSTPCAVWKGSATGSGMHGTNLSLSAEMGYQIYELPTPFLDLEQIDQTTPPLKYHLNANSTSICSQIACKFTYLLTSVFESRSFDQESESELDGKQVDFMNNVDDKGKRL